MDEALKQYYLAELGIQQWNLRNHTLAPLQAPADDTALSWEALVQNAKNCTACSLSKTRAHVVFGTGNTKASLMIVGEAPGYNEDRMGEPFVGKAGQLLNDMLFAIGLSRNDVYIANVLKCRPPNNRDPKQEEVLACQDFLYQQIRAIMPKLILVVGRIAAQTLLKTSDNLTSIRGREHLLKELNTPLLVTFHPAYLLRNPLEKKKALQDLMTAKKMLVS